MYEDRENERETSLCDFGRGKDIGRTKAGAKPIEDRSSVVVLERPLETIRIK